MTSAKAQEALHTLHCLYVKKLPQEVNSLKHLWSQIVRDAPFDPNVVRDMLLAAHSLNGSGATYGLVSISEVFSQLEEALQHLWDEGTVTAQKQSYIDALLDDIKAVAENEVNRLTSAEPVTPPSVDTTDRPARPGQAKRPLILLVDDSEAVRRRLRVFLEADGFQVIEAVEGHQALKQAQTHRPDLIILDVRMPQIDGFEVQRLIRGEEGLSDTPILFLTATRSVSMKEVQTALSYGVEGYLSKTLPMAQVVEKVRATLTAA